MYSLVRKLSLLSQTTRLHRDCHWLAPIHVLLHSCFLFLAFIVLCFSGKTVSTVPHVVLKIQNGCRID